MKVKAVSCPKCGGSIKIKGGDVLNYCAYCGTQVFLDDEVVREEKRIIKDTEVLFCQVCGRSIKKVSDPYYKCPSCGRIVCPNCYDKSRRLCVSCGGKATKTTPKVSKPPEPRIGFYFLSFFLPFVGIIMGIIYLIKPEVENKRFGKYCLLLGLIPFGFYFISFIITQITTLGTTP